MCLEELDPIHLKQVEIYLERIPESNKLWESYDKSQVVEGLHMLSTKYNTDIYDLGNSIYLEGIKNSQQVLPYLNELESSLLFAMEFRLHI